MSRDMDQATEAEMLASDYRAVFGGEAGERVLTDLIKCSGFLAPLAPPATADARAFRDGGRSLICHITDYLRWEPGDLVRLARRNTQEALAREENDYA